MFQPGGAAARWRGDNSGGSSGGGRLFLPLTVNPASQPRAGTRHRAAIGLTEENDAVAMVVSEETGEISITLDGEIERSLSQDELREKLHVLLAGSPAAYRVNGVAPIPTRARWHPDAQHLGLKFM